MTRRPSPLSAFDLLTLGAIERRWRRHNRWAAFVAGVTVGLWRPRVARVRHEVTQTGRLSIMVEMHRPTFRDWDRTRQLAYVAGGVVYVVAAIVAVSYGAAWLAGVR